MRHVDHSLGRQLERGTKQSLTPILGPDDDPVRIELSDLSRHGIDEAKRRGARQLYLTVYVDNQRARRFYDRYGFEAVGRYDFMVGSQADEDLIMMKVL